MSWPRLFGPAGPNTAERRSLLARDGCFLEIVIRADAARLAAAGAVSRREHRGAALIDSGASKVCLDYRIAQELGLRQVDQTTLVVVGSKIEAHLYLAELEVPGLDYKQMIEVVAPKVGQLRYDALLGRTFLSNFIATFHGPDGQVMFDRPTQDVWLPADDG